MNDDNVIPMQPPEIAIASFGGQMDETRVTIGVYGDDLDPDEITQILGSPPRHAHRRGEQRSSRWSPLPPWPSGAWCLSVEGKEPTSPEEVLVALLDRLTADPTRWADLLARFEVRIGFGLFQSGWNRGFELSPAVLRRVADLGLGLGFDVYADGGEEDG